MANKWMKTGSDDSYVLIGGGGHKLICDFATASHTHTFASLTSKPTTIEEYGISNSLYFSINSSYLAARFTSLEMAKIVS